MRLSSWAIYGRKFYLWWWRRYRASLGSRKHQHPLQQNSWPMILEGSQSCFRWLCFDSSIFQEETVWKIYRKTRFYKYLYLQFQNVTGETFPFVGSPKISISRPTSVSFICTSVVTIDSCMIVITASPVNKHSQWIWTSKATSSAKAFHPFNNPNSRQRTLYSPGSESN